MPFVAEKMQLSTSYRRLVLPFLTTYWTGMLDKASFHFIVPHQARAALKRAMKEPLERQGQAILQAIADHLPVRFPAEETEWLRTLA